MKKSEIKQSHKERTGMINKLCFVVIVFPPSVTSRLHSATYIFCLNQIRRTCNGYQIQSRCSRPLVRFLPFRALWWRMSDVMLFSRLNAHVSAGTFRLTSKTVLSPEKTFSQFYPVCYDPFCLHFYANAGQGLGKGGADEI